MKKLLIFATFLFFFTSGKSQSYTYHSFPDSLGIWSSLCYDWMYQFTGMGESYFQSVNDTMSDGYKKYYETNKKVFMKTESDSVYRLLYDFNLTVGDTFINEFYDNADIGTQFAFGDVVVSDDTIGSNFYWPNRRTLTLAGGVIWVEGVGNVISWFGWYNSLASYSISGGCNLECIFDDAYSYPCTNFSLAENALKRISVFPNPSCGQVFISEVTQPTELKIYNSVGVLFQELEIHSDQELDLSHLPKGIYFLTLSLDGTRYSRKIILN